MTDTVEEFLDRILKACEGKRCLFRGVTKTYEGKKETEGAKKINSSLYRWAIDKLNVVHENVFHEKFFHENYQPFDMEKEILERAKRHFAVGVSNIEVLTDLQHFRGKTNLIDFSRSLYIALFFSCYGDEEHHKKEGELILLDSAKIEEKSDVVYAELQSSSEPFLIEPANTRISQKRVTFQNSVFVYPPSGYINRDLCRFEKIPANLKQPILDYLRKIHSIHPDTIYNDLIGFIANEKNYEKAKVLLYEGIALYNKSKSEEEIEKYDNAIELNPIFAEAYNNRGFAKDELGQYLEAIADYNKAIELKPNDAIAYNNHGITKNKLGQHQEAIDDLNKAIKLNPDFAEAYNNRGFAKDELGQYPEAIADYDKAIELDPNYAEAYSNRGVAKSRRGQHREAIADHDKAIELDQNDAIAYNNRGVAKRNLEQHQEAIADHDKAIELKPKYAEAYNNRGIAKYYLGQYDSDNRAVRISRLKNALVDYDKAIELNPNYAKAYNNRGIAKHALGRIREANEDFKMAAKLKGDEAS